MRQPPFPWVMLSFLSVWRVLFSLLLFSSRVFAPLRMYSMDKDVYEMMQLHGTAASPLYIIGSANRCVSLS